MKYEKLHNLYLNFFLKYIYWNYREIQTRWKSNIKLYPTWEKRYLLNTSSKTKLILISLIPQKLILYSLMLNIYQNWRVR